MSLNVKLLRKVKKHILAEPKRFHMGDWATFWAKSERKPKYVPPCRTVACIAGWTVLLAKPLLWKRFMADNVKDICQTSINPETEAATLLGMSRHEASSMFYTSNWPDQFADQYDMANREEKAVIAANRIEHFIKTGE